MSNPFSDIPLRQRWLSALALAAPEEVEAVWSGLPDLPAYERLRGPEVGLAMVRGRAGGDGAAFNLGEMTVTRCAVRLAAEAGGGLGMAYLAGRRLRQAEQTAVLDALLQDPGRREGLLAAAIAPLERAAGARRSARAGQVAATRVDFFTMVRGE